MFCSVVHLWHISLRTINESVRFPICVPSNVKHVPTPLTAGSIQRFLSWTVILMARTPKRISDWAGRPWQCCWTFSARSGAMDGVPPLRPWCFYSGWLVGHHTGWSPECSGCLVPLSTASSTGSPRRWWPFATKYIYIYFITNFLYLWLLSCCNK